MKMLRDLTTYFKESYIELRKVNWPSKKQVFDYTIMVVVISLAVAVFLGGLDYFFGWSLETFIL